MTRVIIVADSGTALAHLTAAVGTVPGAFIVRHGSTNGPLDGLIASLAPDLVIIGDLLAPDRALARLAEVRRAAPEAKVVVVSSTPEADWLPTRCATRPRRSCPERSSRTRSASY